MPAPVWQASGLTGSAVAGHAQHRSRHRIVDAVAVRFGDRNAVGIDRRIRLDAEILHIAVGEVDVDRSVFFEVVVEAVIIGRDQRAVDGRGPGTRRCRNRRRWRSTGHVCRRRPPPKTGRPRYRRSRRPCRPESPPASPRTALPVCLARQPDPAWPAPAAPGPSPEPACTATRTPQRPLAEPG